MAKETKKKSVEASEGSEESPDRLSIRSTLKGVGALAIVATVMIGYLKVRSHVEKEVAYRPDAPRVVLKERPAWMSDGIARRVVAVATPDVARSAFDHTLLVNTAQMLETHPDTAPWIHKVRSVKRLFDKGPGDTIEIDCEFRAPVALVRYGDYFWLVDGDRILLPEQYTPAEVPKVMYDSMRKPVLRIIEGITTPPPQSGQRWLGVDLSAGIDMAKLLHDKPYAAELERINVANFAGRLEKREAQIVLITRNQTQVRWGRPLNARDFFVEVSPQQKLLYMEQLVQKFGRVDAGHTAVDLRFDIVTFPASEAVGTPAHGSIDPAQ